MPVGAHRGGGTLPPSGGPTDDGERVHLKSRVSRDTSSVEGVKKQVGRAPVGVGRRVPGDGGAHVLQRSVSDAANVDAIGERRDTRREAI